MRFILAPLAATLFFLATPAQAETNMDIGVSIGEQGVRGFYMALGEYYRVPEREIVVIRERRIPDPELPVVLYIARQARVKPAAVIDLRLRGRSWMDITLHFGLRPDIYYVPVREAESYGPPYGHAYGHFKDKHKNKHKRKRVRLDDDDVVNLVNLRFISERYGRDPEAIIQMRSSGKDFIVINDEIRRGGKHDRADDRDRGHDNDRKDRRRGKGHRED